MKALLKITTIPMEYQLHVTHARLERGRSGPPVVEITREKGGYSMDSQPAKLNLDTFDARNSVVPTLNTSIYQLAQKGAQAVVDVIQRYSSEAAQMRWSKPGDGGEMLKQLFKQSVQQPSGDFKMAFIPTTGPKITYQPGDLKVDYQMDRLSFELKTYNSKVSYVPGDIDVEITQFPDINIEYMGDPIYVPPSAGEKFLGKELDVKA